MKEGEVHTTGCILQLSNELLEEDRLLEVAQTSLKASEKELIEFQQKERKACTTWRLALGWPHWSKV